MGEMRVMHQDEGDFKHIWDPEIEDECDAMELLFDSLLEKGFTAYRVKKDGEKSSSKMVGFDPNAGKMIMVPKMAGG